MMRQLCLVAVTAAITTFATANTGVFNNPDFFDGLDAVTIDFDSLPPSGDVPPDETPLTDQYADLGILFASEDVPNAIHTTDPDDMSGRFDAPCRYLAALSGGGEPTSPPRYICGEVFAGANASDLRLDFPDPIKAIGVQVIDNDFTTVRFAAYDADGNLLVEATIPEVTEGGFGYWGLRADDISYVIMDGVNNTAMDSTYLDDLSFVMEIPPCPADLSCDGNVDGADLGALLGAWGSSGPGDLDESGTVDGADLGLLLGDWGDCW